MTENMKTAIRQVHGCSRTAKEMGQDTRTMKALERRGIVRRFVRGRAVYWMLTPYGVENYNSLTD